MTKKKKPMSKRQFRLALKELGLTVASKQTSKVLGVGVRHVQRIAKGDQPVPPPLEKLIGMYLKHGINEDA